MPDDTHNYVYEPHHCFDCGDSNPHTAGNPCPAFVNEVSARYVPDDPKDEHPTDRVGNCRECGGHHTPPCSCPADGYRARCFKSCPTADDPMGAYDAGDVFERWFTERYGKL